MLAIPALPSSRAAIRGVGAHPAVPQSGTLASLLLIPFHSEVDAPSGAKGAVMAQKHRHEAVAIAERARPARSPRAVEIQHFGTIGPLPIALDATVCAASVENLNQVLADTMTLRDLYKKHHWQIGGPTFYQLHLLYDKHFNEQSELVDEIAERIQSLGGVSIAMAHDVAEMTLIPRPNRGREDARTQITRLLQAHEIVLKEARAMARTAAEAGDDGTNDLLVSDLIRTGEMQVWFIGEHLVGLDGHQAGVDGAGRG
jgi:starvation-inducible DNA-binding protein